VRAGGGLGLVAALHALAACASRRPGGGTGVALNLLVVGATRFFLRYGFDSSSNSPRVPGFGGESRCSARRARWAGGLLTLPLSRGCSTARRSGCACARWARSPRRRVARRAGGARARGSRCSARARSPASGGAYLALDQHQFTDGMTSGRGFIALAAVIFGRWDPVRVALACLLLRRRRDAADPAAGLAQRAVAVRRDDPVRAHHRRAGRRGGARDAAGGARPGRRVSDAR
jgi:hypothetical protein